MAREYFLAYHSYIEAMEQLNDAECGRLFKACLIYSRSGATQKLGGNERFLFPGMKSQIDRDKEAYQKKCNENKKNGSLGGSVRKRTVANGSERPPNAPQGEGKGEGKDKGEEKGEYEGRARELSAVASAYLNRVNPSASQQSLEELQAFCEALGSDVCIRAMDIALDEKKATWAYIRGILRRLQGQGVRSLADWSMVEKKWQHQKSPPKQCRNPGANVFLEMLEEQK